MGSSLLAILSFVIIGYAVGSVRVINEGNEALVERLGRFRRKLSPGLNFIIPFLDTIVLEDTLREKILDIEPQPVITKDNVDVQVDAVVYWRILELERTFYAIEDIEKAIKESVITTVRSEIGKINLEETSSLREELNRVVLDHLDEITEPWGIKVNRVEIQKILPPEEVLKSMQVQQAAEIRRKAEISEAEGRKKAAILEAEGTVQSMNLISQAIGSYENRKEILNFLIAQKYVDANHKLSESTNSKVIFMNPQNLTEGLSHLLESDITPDDISTR